ncbi:hypothetical protein T4B_6033 [Trichinella pseudospiralis]|uniref:Uncharacterized protein n=1 Tax=Trichinella pseudospiralis TaxID=6337 RepID=A0A0V1GPU8_TRIPS|nr:hypothetical protein T4B_6033 [Trichinella pseudospiralis]
MKFFIIPLFGHKNGQNNQKRILASEPQHLDQTLFPKLEKYCLHDELSPHQDWAYKLNANLASMNFRCLLQVNCLALVVLLKKWPMYFKVFETTFAALSVMKADWLERFLLKLSKNPAKVVIKLQ